MKSRFKQCPNTFMVLYGCSASKLEQRPPSKAQELDYAELELRVAAEVNKHIGTSSDSLTVGTAIHDAILSNGLLVEHKTTGRKFKPNNLQLKYYNKLLKGE